MSTDPIKEKLSRWSLERVEFLLGHVEGFIDDEHKEVRARSKEFVVQSGLEKVQSLVTNSPSDPELPGRVLERLSAFFEAGLLLQRGPSEDLANWWVTDIFWRGNLFHLELKDQIMANHLVQDMAPLQVNKSQAQKILQALKLDFMVLGQEANAFLLKPTPSSAYVLISELPNPWLMDHVGAAHRLINKAFAY